MEQLLGNTTILYNSFTLVIHHGYSLIIQLSQRVAFSSDDQMQQSKLNFLAAQDAIDAHNSQPGVPYKQGLNKFSIMVQLNQ